MKRLKPIERKAIIGKVIANHSHQWTCQLGAWNRNKLLHELEKRLRDARLKGINPQQS